LVFGKFCGISAREYAKQVDWLPLTEGEEKRAKEFIEGLMKREGHGKVSGSQEDAWETSLGKR
jgi:NADH-dependent fumarate reductase subunit A